MSHLICLCIYPVTTSASLPDHTGVLDKRFTDMTTIITATIFKIFHQNSNMLCPLGQKDGHLDGKRKDAWTDCHWHKYQVCSRTCLLAQDVSRGWWWLLNAPHSCFNEHGLGHILILREKWHISSSAQGFPAKSQNPHLVNEKRLSHTNSGSGSRRTTNYNPLSSFYRDMMIRRRSHGLAKFKRHL